MVVCIHSSKGEGGHLLHTDEALRVLKYRVVVIDILQMNDHRHLRLLLVSL